MQYQCKVISREAGKNYIVNSTSYMTIIYGYVDVNLLTTFYLSYLADQPGGLFQVILYESNKKTDEFYVYIFFWQVNDLRCKTKKSDLLEECKKISLIHLQLKSFACQKKKKMKTLNLTKRRAS